MTAAASSSPALPATAQAIPEDRGALASVAMATVIVIWGLGPPMAKLVDAAPIVSVTTRFWISVPIVWSLTYLSGRRVRVAALRQTALAGVFFGVNMMFVFASLQHAAVAVLAILQVLQPAAVLLVAGPWLGERPTRWHVGWTGVAIAGVIGVILGASAQVHTDALGVLFGVFTMLSFTAYYLINRKVRSTTHLDPLEWMAGTTLFSALTVTPLALATTVPSEYAALGGVDWLALGFVTLVVGVFGHTLMSWTHRYMPASRSSLYLLSMNVVAVAAAWPLHDEPITWAQAAGGAVVLGAIAAVISRPASVQVEDLPTPVPSSER